MLLPETVRLFDETLAAAQSAGRVPTLVAGVVRDGRLEHLSTAGQHSGTEPDTQYRIGSITKTLTAAVVLALRDEGRLSLDDLLYRHLPGTPVGGVTVRQLLGHASGLSREPGGEWWERSPGVDVPALLAGLTPDKAAHPPYRMYHYSNLGYGLLGAIIERVTEHDWRTEVGKRLLDPLGMTRTTYHPEEPFARGYVVHPWRGTLREEPRHDAVAMAPAGQLWSTPTDLAKWAAFLADPAPDVLSPATVAEMCAPVVLSDLDSWTAGHGLGLELARRGERIYVGHSGSMPGYLAVLVVHRPSRTGVVAFANAYTLRHNSIGGLGQDLLTLVLDREPDRPTPWRPGSPPPVDVQPLVGRWWWMGREYQATWEPGDDGGGGGGGGDTGPGTGTGHGELVISSLTSPGAEPWRFERLAPNHWRCHTGSNDGEIMRVLRDTDGKVAALDIATFVFTRDPWPDM